MFSPPSWPSSPLIMARLPSPPETREAAGWIGAGCRSRVLGVEVAIWPQGARGSGAMLGVGPMGPHAPSRVLNAITHMDPLHRPAQYVSRLAAPREILAQDAERLERPTPLATWRWSGEPPALSQGHLGWLSAGSGCPLPVGTGQDRAWEAVVLPGRSLGIVRHQDGSDPITSLWGADTPSMRAGMEDRFRVVLPVWAPETEGLRPLGGGSPGIRAVSSLFRPALMGMTDLESLAVLDQPSAALVGDDPRLREDQMQAIQRLAGAWDWTGRLDRTEHPEAVAATLRDVALPVRARYRHLWDDATRDAMQTSVTGWAAATSPLGPIGRWCDAPSDEGVSHRLRALDQVLLGSPAMQQVCGESIDSQVAHSGSGMVRVTRQQVDAAAWAHLDAFDVARYRDLVGMTGSVVPPVSGLLRLQASVDAQGNLLRGTDVLKVHLNHTTAAERRDLLAWARHRSPGTHRVVSDLVAKYQRSRGFGT